MIKMNKMYAMQSTPNLLTHKKGENKRNLHKNTSEVGRQTKREKPAINKINYRELWQAKVDTIPESKNRGMGSQTGQNNKHK